MQGTFPLVPFAAGLATAAFYLSVGIVVILTLETSPRYEREVEAIVGDTALRGMACWLAWPLVALAVLAWSALRRRRNRTAGAAGRL